MNIKVHSAEKIGPVNLGAGVGSDYFYKLFGTAQDGGRTIHATIMVNKGEYEAMVKALVEGREASASLHPTAVSAIQVSSQVDAATTEAIAHTRAKSVRTQ